MAKDLYVTLIPVQGPAPSPWQVIYKGNVGDQPGNYPRVDVPPGEGPHFITFTLAGADKGITFTDPAQMSVKQGGKPADGETHPQIPKLLVTNNGKQLVAYNLNDNPDPIELHYRINFNGHAPLDPIIDNGGTGEQLHDYLLPIAILAAIVLIGVAAWVGHRMGYKSGKRSSVKQDPAPEPRNA